jgi:metal-sulfur cluster biosynthetic enzyme
MRVTPRPIVTLLRRVQDPNAQAPMEVTPLGMVTLVKLVQPPNA